MAGNQKITQLPELAVLSGEDLLLVIDNPSANAVGKKSTVEKFFENIPVPVNYEFPVTHEANATFDGEVNVFTGNNHFSGDQTLVDNLYVADGLVVANTITPANSSVGAFEVGKIFYDENYIYVRTAENVTKRVRLKLFTEPD